MGREGNASLLASGGRGVTTPCPESSTVRLTPIRWPPADSVSSRRVLQGYSRSGAPEWPIRGTAAAVPGLMVRQWAAAGGRASGARAGVARPVGVNVERARRTLDDLARDHHFLDALETRQVEHGIEQDALHDRTQAARPRLALDRLLGDAVERFVGEGEIHRLHLEQALILLDQC